VFLNTTPDLQDQDQDQDHSVQEQNQDHDHSVQDRDRFFGLRPALSDFSDHITATHVSTSLLYAIQLLLDH